MSNGTNERTIDRDKTMVHIVLNIHLNIKMDSILVLNLDSSVVRHISTIVNGGHIKSDE